jgi:hypothetical protein
VRHTRRGDQADDDSLEHVVWKLAGSQANQNILVDRLNLDSKLRLCGDLWCRLPVKALGIVLPAENALWLVRDDRLVNFETTMPPTPTPRRDNRAATSTFRQT